MEEWYLDEASTIRAATSYLDGTLTNWIVAPDGSLKALNTSKFGTGPQFSIFGVAGDGKHLLVFSDHETGRDAAYEYDPETRSFGRTLASDPRLDVGEPIYWSTRAVGVSVPHQVFFDPASARLQAEIDKALPETGNQIISMTRDGSAALVRGTSLDKPAVFYALTLAPKKKLAFLGSDYPELEKYKLATVRIVTYKARDGQAIEATLTTPPGRSGPIPFVILPHGGPTAADPRVFDYLAQFIASRGYGVLQPEFRGSTGFGTDFQRAGNAQWGGLMQRDVDDGTQWLIDQHMADRSRICMVGASYGGYAALYAAASRNDLYRCSAAWAPVSDLDALVHRLQAFDWEDPNIPNIGNGTSDLAAVSPVALAGKMSIPILIGHGEDDFTVPADQSHAMEAALRKAGGRVEAVYYKGENHFMTLESTRRDFFKRLQDFLARNIGQAS